MAVPAAVSREAVVATGTGFTVLGGLATSQASVATTYTVNPATGAATPAGTLPAAVHDGAAVSLGPTTFVVGGGSPNTVATVQSVPTQAVPGAAPRTPGTVAGSLPHPGPTWPSPRRVRTRHHSRPYVVGGYDGTTYQPAVLATTDGTHYATVADLAVPVRYPAVVARDGLLYSFGGETGLGGATTATDAIQVIDPTPTGHQVVAHLPQPLYGASAFVLGGTMYVAGGQVPGGATLTRSTPSSRPPGRS